MSNITHLNFEPGSVWLVGAGPGDPGLLTLRALEALQHADTVIYDALVSKAILEMVRAGASLEYAGKRGGKLSAKQPDIIRRMIECAKSGQRVLRLKGGDPFMFGRGGEEALALAASKIPFQLVPGVTASLGGLASAGIPVTHRTTGHAVTFITGHGSDGKLPNELDWNAISSGSPTLIFYMALANLENITTKLIASGLKGSTPCALVSNATLPSQKVVESPLISLSITAEENKVEAPAILVVGEVVDLRKALDPESTCDSRANAAVKLTSHWQQKVG